MQWRFKLTSTNNNVGTNELECLPIMTPTDEMMDAIADAVGQINSERSKEALDSEHARDVARRRSSALDQQIDRLVYKIYELGQDEIAEIERN